jgi:hypothetical protein
MVNGIFMPTFFIQTKPLNQNLKKTQNGMQIETHKKLKIQKYESPIVKTEETKIQRLML